MNRSSTKPNVLFVVLDQLRADVLNGELAETVDLPNLRAFMDDAVTFTNHATVTCPCGPARASLLTGQYSMNHRAVRNGTPLPLDKANLATELRLWWHPAASIWVYRYQRRSPPSCGG
jgi:arylsulfatase A-like enzyme